MRRTKTGNGLKEMKLAGIVVAAVLFASMCPVAVAFNLAGVVNLDDVYDDNLEPGGGSSGSPGTGQGPSNEMSFLIEDFLPASGSAYRPRNGGNSHGYVTPGYGGQPFDIEAMYAWREGGNLMVSSLLGTPAGGASLHWSPKFYTGDIGIDADGDGIYEYAIDQDLGLIQVDTSVNTTDGKWTIQNGWRMPYYKQHWGAGPAEVYEGAILSNDDSIYYRYDQWGVDPNWGPYTQLDGVTESNLKINTGSERWVFEAAVPYSLIGSPSEEVLLSLTHTCGNDSVQVVGPPGPVPEPATAAIVGLGLIGLQIFLVRKTRSQFS